MELTARLARRLRHHAAAAEAIGRVGRAMHLRAKAERLEQLHPAREPSPRKLPHAKQ